MCIFERFVALPGAQFYRLEMHFIVRSFNTSETVGMNLSTAFLFLMSHGWLTVAHQCRYRKSKPSSNEAIKRAIYIVDEIVKFRLQIPKAFCLEG